MVFYLRRGLVRGFTTMRLEHSFTSCIKKDFCMLKFKVLYDQARQEHGVCRQSMGTLLVLEE